MDHRNKIKVQDPVVKDLTSKKKRTKYDKKAMLIQQEGNCIYFTNISKGTAFLLQGLTENDSKGKNVTIETKGIKYDTKITAKTAYITTFKNWRKSGRLEKSE